MKTYFKLKIEKAKNTDAHKLTELTIRSKSYWNYSKEQVKEWTPDLTITSEYIKQNQVYTLTHNNTIIGFYAFSSINESKVKLNFLFIDPKDIGIGYGKILINDFLKRLENTLFRIITLDADPNVEAFYSKYGFHTTDYLKSSIKDRFLPIMTKKNNCSGGV